MVILQEYHLLVYHRPEDWAVLAQSFIIKNILELNLFWEQKWAHENSFTILEIKVDAVSHDYDSSYQKHKLETKMASRHE